MSQFYRFFRKHLWKYFSRRSQHETENNDKDLVEPGPNTSTDPTTSSLDNPSNNPPFHSDPSTTSTIQPTLVVGIQVNVEAKEDLSSSSGPVSFSDDPLAETVFHSNPPAPSTIESPLNNHNIEVVISAIVELLFSSIFRTSKVTVIQASEEPVPKNQNQNVVVDSPNVEETLPISDNKNDHVETTDQRTAVSEASEILDTEHKINLNPDIETLSIQPFSPGAPRILLDNQIKLLTEDPELTNNEDSLSNAEGFTQHGSSPIKSIPTEFNPNDIKEVVLRTDQVRKVNFALEKDIHALIPIHAVAPKSIQSSIQAPQDSIQERLTADIQSQSGQSNPRQPNNVADSVLKSKQVAESSAHSGLTKGMISGSDRATASRSPKLTHIPRNSTALRHYLESTSTRRVAPTNQVNINKHSVTKKRSVPNAPRTPPSQTVTTERSTPQVKVPILKAQTNPYGLCNGKINFEPAPKDVPKEFEECCHRVVDNADTSPSAGEVSLISLTEVSESTKEVLRSALRKFGMKEMTTEGYWNVRWSDKGIPMEMFQKLLKYQRISRFPGSGLLMSKNNLAKNTSKMKQTFPEEYDFVPETWCLQGEIKRVEQYAKAHDQDCFIVKPNDGSSGRGIIITRNTARLQSCDKMVCQVYISRPFLIDGFKFDLRIYTLITSCRPLRLFVYNEGLARFATEQYHQPNQQNESNRYMHLTNYAVNKRSPFYTVDETKGTLRRLSTINKWLIRHNIDSKKVWESMDDAIVKTIISFLPALRHYYRVSFPDQTDSNSCFQIMGFDIIFDENLKPYVLEVNDSPSFKADVPLDKEMTEALIHDTFNILHLYENNRSKVLMEERRQSRMRLLSSSTQNRKKLHKEKEQSQHSLTQSRIEWENAHMGNFRKVFPNDSKQKNYKNFIRASHEIFQHHPW